MELLDLVVPPLVEYGSSSEIVLDCAFSVISDEEEKQLDVKWYHDEQHSPFLQWIPGYKPQVRDIFSGT